MRRVREEEERVHGLHACRALFDKRREDIRRVYVEEARVDDVRDVLKWCAKQSVAYHVLGPKELEKATSSSHHEGICFIAKKPKEPTLDDALKRGRLLLLENVRDPHNVGAIVRTAAHFGVKAVLLAGESARRSPAMLRTAEGGAEHVALVSVADARAAAKQLQQAGVKLLATSSRARASLYDAELPARVCVMFGAEREGLSDELLRAADHVVVIDGTGAVESLNVATATAVVLAELWRRAKR